MCSDPVSPAVRHWPHTGLSPGRPQRGAPSRARRGPFQKHVPWVLPQNLDNEVTTHPWQGREARMCRVEAEAGRGLARGVFELTFSSALLTPCERLEHRGEPKEGDDWPPRNSAAPPDASPVFSCFSSFCILGLDLSHVTVWMIFFMAGRHHLSKQMLRAEGRYATRRGASQSPPRARLARARHPVASADVVPSFQTLSLITQLFPHRTDFAHSGVCERLPLSAAAWSQKSGRGHQTRVSHFFLRRAWDKPRSKPGKRAHARLSRGLNFCVAGTFSTMEEQRRLLDELEVKSCRRGTVMEKEAARSHAPRYLLLVLMGSSGTFYLRYVAIHMSPVQAFETRSPCGDAGWPLAGGQGVTVLAPHVAPSSCPGSSPRPVASVGPRGLRPRGDGVYDRDFLRSVSFSLFRASW